MVYNFECTTKVERVHNYAEVPMVYYGIMTFGTFYGFFLPHT